MAMYKIKQYIFVLLWIFANFSCFFAEKEILCELAAFIENPDGSNAFLIDSGQASKELKSCDEENQKKCIQVVENHVIEGTQRGNFSLSLDREEYTIGDVLCDKADAVEENVRNKMVQIYWRLCGSKWARTSFKMPEPLCCEDGLYVPCKKITS
ncbi:uncharacterized protein TNCT_66511 [Trichonephila clavata]|uniref:Uncharacterized protein n=1 Tax=Trichonephila clavata TaxID=2740835 RepID=A0A8X6KX33_TRICU|nr:uncharacterized protein TNCT_66511 [Trichonephila clavata]